MEHFEEGKKCFTFIFKAFIWDFSYICKSVNELKDAACSYLISVRKCWGWA
jgi:hypothetical protein